VRSVPSPSPSAFVAGSDTLIGGAVARRLSADNVALVGKDDGPDLRDRVAVDRFFERARPTHVFLAAGRSAGISANQRFPADLILDNLLVECHVVDAAFRYGAVRLLYLASSCCYPKLAEQPMAPGSLLTGPLEPTSQSYAVAKIAGIELCAAYRRQHGCDFVAALCADAFGPGDDFSAEDSHVVAALIRRMHEAKESGAPAIDIWGSGRQRRDFIFVDDLADACIHVMSHAGESGPVNLSAGTDVSIRELAEAVQRVVGFRGVLRFDASRPDGMPRKSLDAGRLRALGWNRATPLEDALRLTYDWFQQHVPAAVPHPTS
jgi:GDP-L-fucose synthase